MIFFDDQFANKKKLFTASTEAILLVLVDNCYSKWWTMCDFWSKNGYRADLPDPLTKEQREQMEKEGKSKEEIEAAANNDMFDAKYTASNAGKCPYGTFSPEGLQLFNQLTEQILARRKENKAEILEFEREYRDGLCERKGISKDGKSTGRKRKGKAGGVAESKRRSKVAFTHNEDESEEE